MEDERWFRNFTFWQRAIRLVLLVLFIRQVQLHLHLYNVLVGIWGLIINRLWPPAQFFASLMTLLVWLGISLFFYIVFIFWLAQFVLPVTQCSDRSPAAWRLFVFSFFRGRWHGPAIFFRGGETDAHTSEIEKSGPGIAFVDLRSAITLDLRSRSKQNLTPVDFERPQKNTF
jgi:hypothetical protein